MGEGGGGAEEVVCGQVAPGVPACSAVDALTAAAALQGPAGAPSSPGRPGGRPGPHSRRPHPGTAPRAGGDAVGGEEEEKMGGGDLRAGDLRVLEGC